MRYLWWHRGPFCLSSKVDKWWGQNEYINTSYLIVFNLYLVKKNAVKWIMVKVVNKSLIWILIILPRYILMGVGGKKPIHYMGKVFSFFFYLSLTDTQLVIPAKLLFGGRWGLTHHIFVCHACFVFVCLFSLSNKNKTCLTKWIWLYTNTINTKTFLLNAIFKIWPKV